MAHYRVKVSTSEGVRTLDVDAADPQAAEAQGRRNGTVIEVRRERASILKRGMSPADRFTFMIRLSGHTLPQEGLEGRAGCRPTAPSR